MKVRIPIRGTAESHFRIMLVLMLVFYFADLAMDVITGMKVVPEKPGGTISRDAFLVLMGIAVGIFRGMAAAGGEEQEQPAVEPPKE